MIKLEPFAHMSRYEDNQTLCYAQSNGCRNASNYETLVFGMERKGHKTKKYWPYMIARQTTGKQYWTSNILNVEPFTAETELEAKEKLLALLDKHIQDLQEIRDSINNLPFRENP
jgi:hypothetical protein